MLIECNVQLASNLCTGALGDGEELIEFTRTTPFKPFRDVGHNRNRRLANLVTEAKILCEVTCL